MGGLVENLKRRAEIIRAVRAFFDNRGFTEVATPVLISAPVIFLSATFYPLPLRYGIQPHCITEKRNGKLSTF